MEYILAFQQKNINLFATTKYMCIASLTKDFQCSYIYSFHRDSQSKKKIVKNTCLQCFYKITSVFLKKSLNAQKKEELSISNSVVCIKPPFLEAMHSIHTLAYRKVASSRPVYY